MTLLRTFKAATMMVMALSLIFTVDGAEAKKTTPKKKGSQVFRTPGIPGSLHSVKRDKKAANGECLAPVTNTTEAKEILARNGVSVQGKVNDRQLLSVAIGIQHVELLSDGPSRYVQGAVFTFPKKKRWSEQNVSAIAMGANHVDGNVAHIMHELGHYAGGRGLYTPYKSTITTPCLLTGYSPVNYTKDRYRNEEFAEVFAAFFTHPDLLMKSEQMSCRQAYAFMITHFKASLHLAVCDPSTISKALKDRPRSRDKMLLVSTPTTNPQWNTTTMRADDAEFMEVLESTLKKTNFSEEIETEL